MKGYIAICTLQHKIQGYLFVVLFCFGPFLVKSQSPLMCLDLHPSFRVNVFQDVFAQLVPLILFFWINWLMINQLLHVTKYLEAYCYTALPECSCDFWHMFFKIGCEFNHNLSIIHLIFVPSKIYLVNLSFDSIFLLQMPEECSVFPNCSSFFSNVECS